MLSGPCTPAVPIASGLSVAPYYSRSELDPLRARLFVVASVWFALWLVYVLFMIRYFPKVQTVRQVLLDVSRAVGSRPTRHASGAGVGTICTA